MDRKKMAAFFLCLCMAVASIQNTGVMVIMASETDGSDGFFDNTFIGELIGNIADFITFLKDKVPDKEMTILNNILDQRLEFTVKYKENAEAPEDEKKMEYKKWFDLELYKNEYNIISNSKGTIKGTEIHIPSSVSQTGIMGDFTNINYVPGNGWILDCKTVYDLWVSLGSHSDRGIATINGYYLVAVRPQFGDVGDVIGVHLEDGTEINCIIMDIKGSDASEWGHDYGGRISIIEWEANGGHKGQVPNVASGCSIDLTDWQGKKVMSIVNGGQFVDGMTGSAGVGSVSAAHRAENDDPHYTFQTYGDESGITEAEKIFLDTKWAALENLMVSIQITPEIKALLSDEVKKYEDKIDMAAKMYGFPVYKELFKAIAEYRHAGDSPDIFDMGVTELNPLPGKSLTTEASIEIAAQLFGKCLEAAKFPDPSSAEGLKALLQAFEFCAADYIKKYDNHYTQKTAEEYASAHCDGKIRTSTALTNACGRFDYRDQKFPPKVLKYYSVLAVGAENMPASEQQLLTEAMASWPSNLAPGRKAIIQKGLSVYGRVTYSMDYRLQPSEQAPTQLDCSSFVGWSYKYSGYQDVDSWWTTGEFIDKWNNINRYELIPGDVGLLNTIGSGGANHIGIYIGKSSTGSNVWLHCTGFHKEAPLGMDRRHTLNRGVKITDDAGRVDGYACNWSVFRRYTGFV